MEDREFDVVIVGAGPSGCACAHQLSGSGLRVAIVEKDSFPRDKVCGDALSKDVENQFFRIGEDLGQKFLDFSKKLPIREVRFVSANGENFDLRRENSYEHPPIGFVSTRSEFDDFFFGCTKELPDIEIFTGHKVTDIEITAKAARVLTDKSSFGAKMLVGADGANSVVNRKLNVNPMDRRHVAGAVRQYWKGVEVPPNCDTIELHYQEDLKPGYFWIFPLPNNQFNVGLGMSSDEISKHKINLKSELKNIIENHPEISARFKNAEPLETVKGFPIPLGSKKVKCSGERLLLLGDAAYLANPFTGEGIGNAIRSGRMAADHLKKCFQYEKFDAKFNESFDKGLYEKVWTELKVAHVTQRLARYPWIMNWIFKKTRKNRSLNLLFNSIWDNSDVTRLLKKPGFYLRLLIG